MKVLFWDERAGEMRVRAESQDDLWTLYNVVERGDLVYAKTTRELKSERSGSKRRSMTLGLKVEWAEFQPFTTRLRVHGIVVDHPKEYEVHGHHTANVDVGDELKIVKDRWTQHQLERIKSAVERSRLGAALVALDDEEAAVGLLHDYGVEILSELKLNLPGKLDPQARSQALEEELAKISSALKDVCSRYGVKVVVIAGPGFWKDLLAGKASDSLKGQKVKVYVEDASTGGARGVHEALKRGVALKILRDYSIIEEGRLLSEFLEKVSKAPEVVAYGLDQVKKADEANAIEKLLVLDELLRSQDEVLRREVEELVRSAERRRAKVKIFSSSYEAGAQLKNLGGIAAILKFKLLLRP